MEFFDFTELNFTEQGNNAGKIKCLFRLVALRNSRSTRRSSHYMDLEGM